MDLIRNPTCVISTKGLVKPVLCKHGCENCRVQAICDTIPELTCKARAQRGTFHKLFTFLFAMFQTHVAHKSVWTMGHGCWSATNGIWLQQRSDPVSPVRSLFSDFLQLVLQIFTWAQDQKQVECQYQSVYFFVFCQLQLKRFFTYLWLPKPNPICGMSRYNEICKGLRAFLWVRVTQDMHPWPNCHNIHQKYYIKHPHMLKAKNLERATIKSSIYE